MLSSSRRPSKNKAAPGHQHRIYKYLTAHNFSIILLRHHSKSTERHCECHREYTATVTRQWVTPWPLLPPPPMNDRHDRIQSDGTRSVYACIICIVAGMMFSLTRTLMMTFWSGIFEWVPSSVQLCTWTIVGFNWIQVYSWSWHKWVREAIHFIQLWKKFVNFSGYANASAYRRRVLYQSGVSASKN